MINVCVSYVIDIYIDFCLDYKHHPFAFKGLDTSSINTYFLEWDIHVKLDSKQLLYLEWTRYDKYIPFV